MIRGVNQIDLTVGRAEEWAPIGALLGASIVDRFGGSTTSRTRNINVALRIADPVIAERCGRVHETGITHVCLQSRDAEGLYASLASASVAFNAPLTTLGNGTHYAYGALPSGATIEVETAGYAPDDYQGSWIAHVALATPDLRRLSGFYSALTGRGFVGGWQVKPSAANDVITGYDNADMIVGWVPCGNVMIEFWQYLNPVTEPRTAPKAAGSPGYSGLVLEVDDLPGRVDSLVAAGVSELGRIAVDVKGVARVSGRDPDRNALGFIDFSRATDRSGALDTLADPGLMPRLSKYRATLPLPHFRPEMPW